jgi:hypothetical protein
MYAETVHAVYGKLHGHFFAPDSESSERNLLQIR